MANAPHATTLTTTRGPMPHMHRQQDAFWASNESAAPSDCVSRPPAMDTDWHGAWNPLLELAWKPAYREWRTGAGFVRPSWREAVEPAFSWPIPTAPALRVIRDLSPGRRVMELGAGTGYWAALLASLGAHVVACDAAPANKTWFPVQPQRAGSFVRTHGADHSLLVTYPRSAQVTFGDRDTADVTQSIDTYAETRKEDGGTIFVVGERPRESTDDVAARLLSRGWEIVKAVALPRWPYKHDILLALQYKGTPDDTPLGLEVRAAFNPDRAPKGITNWAAQFREWRDARDRQDTAACKLIEQQVEEKLADA